MGLTERSRESEDLVTGVWNLWPRDHTDDDYCGHSGGGRGIAPNLGVTMRTLGEKTWWDLNWILRRGTEFV